MKFHHVFFFLMLIAAASAFGVQPRFSNRGKGPFQALFIPVSGPARALAGWGRGHLVREPRPVVVDGRGEPMGDGEIHRQNEDLRRTVMNLSAQLEELRRRSEERDRVGNARPYCTPLGVFASDSGSRKSLLVRSAGVEGLQVGMPVLYEQSIVGRLENVGLGAAQVKLVTDSGFRVSGAFRRLGTDERGQAESRALPTSQPPLIEGDGRGRMVIRNLDMKEVAAVDLKAGDWVVLNDGGPDWPLILQGYKLGEVMGIRPRPDQPLHAQIEVRPPGNWMHLREVMVLNKKAEVSRQ